MNALWTVLLLSLVSCRVSFAALQCGELFRVSTATTAPTAVSQDEIRKMLAHSRDGARERSFRTSSQEFFARVLNQRAFSNLNPKDALEYLSLFAQWRLLPPAEWSSSFLLHVEGQIKDWSAQDFLSFALQRKLTPLALPPSFLSQYHQALKNIFSQLNATAQLETFSAELYQGSPWGTADLLFFIRTVTESLKNDSQKLRLKPIKEMHRSLLFLSEQDRAPLNQAIAALTDQL